MLADPESRHAERDGLMVGQPHRSGLFLAEQPQGEVDAFDLTEPASVERVPATVNQVGLEVVEPRQHPGVDVQHRAAHACVRCPMLHLDPGMLPRMQQLQDDLVARRRRAVDEGWLGEVDGIDLTLRLLREKQAGAAKLTRRTVEVGMPGLRPS
jgi:hypothetical protein